MSTTCGEITSPVHKLACIEPGTCDTTITTASSVLSVTPLMIPCETDATDGGALHAAQKAATPRRPMERFIGALY